MSSKRKSLPTRVLESCADSSEMIADSMSEDINHPQISSHSILATPDHSDSSIPGSEYSVCAREEPGVVSRSPSCWNEADSPTETAVKRGLRETPGEMDDPISHPFHPMASPLIQAQIHEARLQQDHARLLEEAALRYEQQNHLNNNKPMHTNPSNHFNLQLSQQIAMQQSLHNGNSSPTDLLGRKSNMEDVLKRLTSRITHRPHEDLEKLKPEK